MANIELIIKLQEEVHEHILKAKSVPDVLGVDIVNTINAVKNGTLLPKGCKRLVDVDGFINSLKGIERLHIDDELRNSILDAINANILVETNKENAIDYDCNDADAVMQK